MAAAYKSASQVNRGNVSSIVCDKPADIADGDHLTFLISQDGAHTITDGGGLTSRGSQAGPGSDSTLHVLDIYVPVAASAPASWTVTSNTAGGGTIVGRISATGIDPTTPFDVAAVFGTETSANPSAGPITPSANGCLLIGANSTDPAAGTYTGTATSGAPAPGWVERIEFGVSATSNLYVETYLQTTAAGVTTNPTMSGSDDYATVVLALRPASGAQTVSPSAIATAEAFYSPTLTTGAVTVSPSFIATAEAVYTPTVTSRYTLTAPFIASAEAFYSPTVTPGAVTISPSAIATAEAFYSPSIAGASVSLFPAFITSLEHVFAPVLTGGALGRYFGATAGAGGTRTTPANAGAGAARSSAGTAGAGGQRGIPGTPGSGTGRI